MSQQLEDTACAGLDAARQVAIAKSRQNQRLHDDTGCCVGQHALQPIANLDPHLAFIRSYKEQHTIVILGLAELPVAKQPIGEFLDTKILQRANRRHHDLIAGRLFVRGKIAGQACFRIRRQDIGVVHHPAG